MTDKEVKELCDCYNRLLASSNYWIDGGMRLVEHLHNSGMKYRDIYTIMEREPARLSA